MMDIVSVKTHEGHAVLALNTGLTSRAFAQSKLPRCLTLPAFVLDPSGSVERWNMEGTFCEASGGKETVFAYGPAFSGATLLAIVQGVDRKAAWEGLYRTISLITKANLAGKIGDETLRDVATAGPGAIVCANDGRILILPSELYIRALSAQSIDVVTASRFFWVHPDAASLNTSWSFAFLSGTLAYRIAAGREPFPAPESAHKSGEDGTVHEQIARSMNGGIFEPIELAVWNIRPAAAACINALISTDVAASTDTLLAFGPDFSSLLDPSKEGTGATVDFLEKKKSAKRQRDAAIGRESFFRRHRRAFRISAVVVGFFAFIGAILVHDLRSKPSTQGMLADEVIHGYYAAIANLDQEIPTAYAAHDVQIDYADIITNLYVTNKMREAYERDAGLLTPAKLFAEGKPGKKAIFGLTRLDIRQGSADTGMVHYEVSYYLWLPVGPEGKSGAESNPATNAEDQKPLTIYRYQDSVTLSLIKNRWLVSRITPKERALVTEAGEKIYSEIEKGNANAEQWAPSPEEIAGAKAK